ALALGSALGATVAGLRRRALTAVAEAEAAAEAAAVRDQLTGLANRRGVAMFGPQIVEAARRQGNAVHCLFVDIDGFKAVNRRLGTEAGDEVLVAVAEALRSATRATDVVGRWGADEFCVVGPGTGQSPAQLERRVRDRLLNAPPVDLDVWNPRVTAGAATLTPWDAGNLDTLLSKGDQELYLRRAIRNKQANASKATTRD
ncbi:MAG: GGDEF domain-containing protein, partial [Actinomycetota bacterium]|nr:GGDEF domain-containing protein [Actinomycetota bacterium]